MAEESSVSYYKSSEKLGAKKDSISEYKPIRKSQFSIDDAKVNAEIINALASQFYATIHKFKEKHSDVNGSEILTAMFQACYILTQERGCDGS